MSVSRASIRLLLLLLSWCFPLDGHAQTYTIRYAGGPAGPFVRPPINTLFSDDSYEFARPAMALNLSGQYVTGGFPGASSYLVLPAPAYGLAAGYHLLPSGFTAQAIGYGGHIVGIVASNKTVAVWTNGVLRNLGKLNFDQVINADVSYRGVVTGTALTRLAGRTFTSAAFIAQPGATNLQLMFPGFDGSTATFGMNSFADVVGLDFPTGGTLGRFVTRGGNTIQPGSREYLPDLLLPEMINDWGDSAGIKYPIQISTNTSQGSHVFTYAPYGGTDLPHTVAEEPSATYSGVFALNGRGQVLCYADGYYLYQSGALKKLDDLIPVNSGWQQLIGADLNDNGWIIGSGTYNGQSGSAFVMIPVGLDARASVSQGTVALGENVTFSVTLSNATSATTLTQVQPTLFPLDGSGQVVYVNGPTPASTTLAPGQSTNFAYTLRGSIPGRIRIFTQGSAKNPAASSYYFTNVFSDYVYAPLDIGELSAFVEATPRQVLSNDIIHVTLTAHNESSTPVTAVRPVGNLTVTGSGNAELVTGPSPTNVVSLAAHSTASFSYDYRASQEGRVSFSGRVQGTSQNNSTVQSFDAFSQFVTIGVSGDLLIKGASESSAQFQIDNEYQTAPAGKQVHTNTVAPKELSESHVKIQNDDTKARTFLLKATDYGNSKWVVKYKFNSQDISGQIRSTGFTLPQLPTNSFHTVMVQMTGTNVVAGDQRRVLLALEDPLRPGETIDVVEAVTDVASEIIVNTTGDEPDASLTDNLPDVDLVKPGLQTTLRCAIDFANRRDGKDLIKFQIPPEDPNWVDGAPQIEPATALPEITGTVIIDGWTQNTNSPTPPIVLSGKKLPRPPRPASPNSYYFWPGAIPALVVNGEACELRGLVINQFPTGLELAGAGSHVVEGCFFGLNAAGTTSLGNGVDGGGTYNAMRDPDGYTQTAGSDLGYEYTPSFYDDRYVTWFLTGAAGVERPQLRARGWDVRVTSPQNRLGGTTDRQRNRFGSVANFIGGVTQAQNAYRDRIEIIELPSMIWIDGQAAFANTVLNSSFGVKVNESDALVDAVGSFVDPPNSYRSEPLTNLHSRAFSPAIRITDAPGTLVGDSEGGGNLFASAGIELSGTNCIGSTVFGNLFGVSRDGNLAYRLNNGIFAHDCGFVQIGGLNVGEANRFLVDLHAITLVNLFGQTSRVLGNMIGASSFPDALVQIGNVSPTEVRGNTFYDYHYKALWIGVENNTPPASTVSILDNKFIHDRHGRSTVGTAISIDGGRGHTAIGNQLIAPPDERLIVLKPQPTFFYSPGSGPGTPIPPLPNDDFDLDGGPNNRQNWPVMATALLTNGQLRVQAGVDTGISSGQYSFHVYRCFADQWYHGQPQELVATGFGNADASGRAAFIATVPIGPVAEGDFLCATATGPDGSTSEVGPVRRVIGGPDGDTDGVGNATENRTPPRSLQVRSIGDGNGDGVSDSQQANVTSLPVAANQWLTLAAPAGITFSNVDSTTTPSLTNAPIGYTFPLGFVSFTLNGLTPGGTVSVTNILHGSATISNVFAFGPTPGNSQPHWYQLNFTRAGDELRLSFTDGSTGDHDLSANGHITTLYAPAAPIPPSPRLTLLSHQFQPLTAIIQNFDGTNSVFSTNLVTQSTTMLAWPATFAGYSIEYTLSLSPANWLPLQDEAIVIGDQLVVTNITISPSRFYRLRPGSVTLAKIVAPTLNIQRTVTNTFLLSWPSSFAGFVLQYDTNLVAGTWTSVTKSVNVTNGLNQVVVPPATGSRFFRLKSQ